LKGENATVPSASAHGAYFFSPTPTGPSGNHFGSGIGRGSGQVQGAAAISGSRYPSTSTKTSLRNSLPFIPDVNKDRATFALKAINTAWNNGNFDKIMTCLILFVFKIHLDNIQLKLPILIYLPTY
jgi:hypothetical protein